MILLIVELSLKLLSINLRIWNRSINS